MSKVEAVPHYDPDTRRWMVQDDQFFARPATERETYEAVKRYLAAAVVHAREELGDEVAEDVISAAFDDQSAEDRIRRARGQRQDRRTG